MFIEIIFQSSPWYVGFCLLLGAVYAFLLYQPAPAWSKQINWLLAFLRGTLVSLIAFLLLAPLLRSIQTRTDKPKVVLAIDNSESLVNYGPKWLPELVKLRENLAEAGLEVTVQTLNNENLQAELPSLRFDQRSSNLSELLSNAKNNYEGRNLTDVVLLTDGISNQGLTPTFGTYPFRVHTVGIGDTLPKRDVSLKAITANKIAYLGNQFPIQADIVASGFAGRTVGVTLKQNGNPVARQVVTFKQNNDFQQVTFQTTSNLKGVQHYVVEVEALSGEFTTKNNRRDVYLDIVDGKEKILLLALAAHPDLKAIRSIIERNLNYELDIKIMGLNPNMDLSGTKYDLIILHQLPDYFNVGSDILNKLLQRDNTPVFFILGNQSNASAVTKLNGALNISAGAGQIDKVTGRFNANFNLLNLDPEKLQIIEKLPPLTVPFGEYGVRPGAEVVLLQNVGNVKTNKALLALNTAGPRKSAVLAGEGIWQWRMEEYALTEKQEAVDELLLKVMQLISVKEDKRKFRVYPLQNEINVGERAAFETEIYNDIYEKTYGQSVRLEITDERGKMSAYTYTNTKENSRFERSGLAEGLYRYKATTSINGKIENAEGQFVVRDLQLEALNLTADFGMLRQLSNQTGGKFSLAAQLETLQTYLINNKAPSRLDSTEDLSELIQQKWLFFLLLLLVTTEWGIRKYQGSY
ncbi:MAG: VWA domain-containing protein [Runella slithyformis]|nr:MAG: VWA domain-containing protein [Runella slithyformis]TAE94809.1 MAG: VWA domain-containing protein [Runella slithyformis]TAF25656.1 MAG: VWA domain-containing protein [Runella slithyformis]TAF44001.1 MAG: VWA domain-containing protein [Runella slithyformis]TAF79939.1 MAG: VWA domain-containing protein [Runella slithyformis]